MSYEAFGALTGANYGNGLRMVQSWGNDGRLAERRLERSADSTALSSLTYTYDNSDNITQIADTLDATKTRSFDYDPVERLTRMDGAVGSFAREDYLHDDNGNRLAVERRATVADAIPAETDSYSIAPGTNRLTAITTPTGTRSFTHDARGNQTGETRPDGAVVTVSYDGRARLTSYSVGTATQTMLYNGADERIRVVTTPASGPTDTRIFLYDLDHRIVGEYGAGGATDLKAEYIWTLSGVGETGPTGGDDGTGGYTPLAVAVGVAGTGGITSEIQWVHASHLGTPILTTNASGQSVTPYGYAAIGFPGQFANALLLPGAEHYYNRYRDYDPTTGRYIQADPIGLAGDENAWVYAGGNPLTGVDPLGLEKGWLEWAVNGGVDFFFGEWVTLYEDPSFKNFGIAAIGCIPIAKGVKVIRKLPIWSSTKKLKRSENAFGHWQKHGSQFPQFGNAKQYVEGAHRFLANPPPGTLIKVRPNGERVLYNPKSNTFAAQAADGSPKTMFKPASGLNYWNKQ
jgi:RHS repeat-associated protein